MRVLVTGHEGYLGTVIAHRLLEAGHEITGLDAGWFADCVLGAPPSEPPRMRMDIRDVAADDLTGYDAVIHLAALPEERIRVLGPELITAIDHHASVRLARLAKEAGVHRFLYASACSAYGAADGEIATENTPLRPLTIGTEMKARVEEDLAALADGGFGPVFLRCATAFGFSSRPRSDTIVNDLVGRAVLTGEILVRSGKSPWYSLVHIEDIATAFLLCLTAPFDSIHTRAFNIGTEENNLTDYDIAREVLQAVRGSKLVYTDEPPSKNHSFRVDFSAARNSLGYRARRSVHTGAFELATHYIARGLTIHESSRRFARSTRLETLLAIGALDATLRPTSATPLIPPPALAGRS
ncbi:NAD-dependent epimerase/dehydratase family protein [Nocardia brasiliensis]